MRFISDSARKRCPRCDGELQFSRARSWDRVAQWLNYRPRRCAFCRTRYYVRKEA